MRYLNIPSLSVPVSRMAMGSTYFGTAIDERTAMAMLDMFATANGTAIDTARVYGQEKPGGASLSERVIGRWLRETGMGTRMAVATKGLHPAADGTSRYSARNLMLDLDQSRETLGCDVIDLWFLHRDDPTMPVGEIMDMVAPVVQSGAVRALGASNWHVERIAAANAYASEHHLPRFVASEIQWSLAASTPRSWNDPTLVCMDRRSLDWYRREGMPVFAFSSQAKGLFSKAIAHGIDGLSEKSRTRFLSDANRERIDRVRELADQTGLSPAAIAIGYITSEMPPSVAIVGCSSVDQLRDSLSGADVRLSPSELSFLTGENRDAT